jgi:RNA-directed DNA polymerase
MAALTFVKLLQKLEKLLVDHRTNHKKIVSLLEAHRDLAEYEVIRFYAARTMLGDIEASARSLDPDVRHDALRAVAAVLPRSLAAKIVRHMVKDGDSSVRRAALSARRRLQLWHEVSLPDPYAPKVRFLNPRPGGTYNPTGWAYGLYRPRPRPRPLDKAPRPCESLDELATWLGAEDADALERLTRPGAGDGAPYVELVIPKKSGAPRTLHAPRQELKRMQRTLLDEVLAGLPVHPACHGFVQGRSTVTNAAPHVGSAVVVKLDLRDFFPTVHFRRVRGLFLQLGYPHDVAMMLARLTTHRPVTDGGTVAWPGILPQGAPTSPAIINLICRRMDERLAGLAARVGATYTRYADDLTFSFRTAPEIAMGRFMWWVDQICQQEGFAEHPGKRRVRRRSNQQRVTGLTVNDKVAVPRELRRRFRAILHNCRVHGIESQAREHDNFPSYLRGFAAYLSMVDPERGKRYCAEVEALLGGEPA